jgi:hypothetical protein
MERELWNALYRLTCQLSNDRSGHAYPVRWIVGVYLWAVVHDRPVSWACRPENWPSSWRVRLPSQSTASRRLRTAAAVELLEQLRNRCCHGPHPPDVSFLDGKPLPVGGFTKDPEATRGHGVGGPARGYKIHAVWTLDALVACEVQPLNVSEQTVARRLLPQVGGGCVLADANDDSNPLHEVAARAGVTLIAPQRRAGRALGHRRHSVGRLQSIELLTTDAGQELYKQRTYIEQRFAQLTNFGGGLGPLPNWVRRLKRVKLWVNAKLCIHAARNHLRRGIDLMAIA